MPSISEHTTSHHSPSGATTRPFTSVSSRQYIHNNDRESLVVEGGISPSRRSRLESRNIISSSAKISMLSIRMHNEGGRDGALVGIPSCGAKQNKRHVSTRQIIGKSLRTRSTTEKSECNKPRHVTSPALSIYI
eukprot:scaffold9654_cov77-Skeletonema_dohrnii-CCMP3373.AAC.1